MSDEPGTGELATRAATQRGETGDKIAGFDPAAAPLETDAEAGGAPFGGVASGSEAAMPRPPQTSTGGAMRPIAGMETPVGGRGWVLPVAALSVIAILVLAALVIW